MNALDSPLEALTLNYLTYGFLTAVNNIWAWLAVITAAVSFLSIRALSSPPPPTTAELRCMTMQECATTSSLPMKVAAVEVLSATAEEYACPMWEREGGTKTKFSTYYVDDGCREDDDEGDEREDGGGGGAAARERWCDDWERMMVVRMGDMGWYRWQDTAVLDGSVVRLWEGTWRRYAAAAVVDGGGAW